MIIKVEFCGWSFDVSIGRAVPAAPAPADAISDMPQPITVYPDAPTDPIGFVGRGRERPGVKRWPNQ